jgi:hypothetical protein
LGLRIGIDPDAISNQGVFQMATIEYGEHKLDLATLPETSLVALAQAGLAHTLGNVVASRVVAEIRKAINPEKPSDVTTEAVKAWRKTNEDKISVLSVKFQSESLEAINAGTLGVHVARGPSASADPLQAEMHRIAKAQISVILSGAGMKFPGAKLVKGKDGNPDTRVPETVTLKGSPWTGAQLIANRLDPDYPNNNRAEIEREAKSILAARKRDAEKQAAKGVDSL